MSTPATLNGYHIQVKEPGAKKSKLYGGQGRIVTNVIYAIVYEHPLEKVQAFCDELASQNPGYEFKPRIVPQWTYPAPAEAQVEA